MEIRLLLEKYKNLGFSQKRIKEIMILTCEKFSLKLKGEDVDIKQTEIKINISGVRRTHFVLLKQKVETALQEELKKEGLLVTKIY